MRPFSSISFLLALPMVSAFAQVSAPPAAADDLEFSPRRVVIDGAKVGTPEFRIGCIKVDDTETREKLADCTHLRFFVVRGKDVSMLNENDYKWADFGTDGFPKVAVGIRDERSGQAWERELGWSKDVSWSEGERSFPRGGAVVRKTVDAVNGAFEWVVFHVADGLTYVGTKPHYWTVRKRERRSLAAYRFLTLYSPDAGTASIHPKRADEFQMSLANLQAPPVPAEVAPVEAAPATNADSPLPEPNS